MAKYAVRVVETLARTVIAEADDFEEAVQKAIDAHQEGEIVLDADDFDDSYFVPSEIFGKKAIDENDDRLSLFPRLPINPINLLVGKYVMTKKDKKKHTVTKVIPFEEDTFGQGNFAVETDDGKYLYECEIEILD